MKKHKPYEIQKLERKIELIGNINVILSIISLMTLIISSAKGYDSLQAMSYGAIMIEMIIHMYLYPINEEE